MTDSEKQQLRQFEARVRQLLLQYKTLQDENLALRQTIERQQTNIDSLAQQLQQAQLDYRTLKTARMIEVSDGDLKNAKQTITRLVREVNKCIGLLSAEQFTAPDASTQKGDAEPQIPVQDISDALEVTDVNNSTSAPAITESTGKPQEPEVAAEPMSLMDLFSTV